MNNDEAKFILRAYRPSGRDAGDPTFAAALAQAQLDPMLKAWFNREQGIDMVVAGKLREIMPPAGLRDRILAGGRASRRIRPMQRRVAAWLGVAAGIIVVLGLSEVWQGRRVEAARQDYAQFALQDTRHGNHHAVHGAGMQAVLAMLGGDGVALPGALPLDLKKLKADGCRTVRFAGQEAFEICFKRDGEWYHLYVTARGALPRSLLDRSPAMVAMNDGAVAVWSDSNYDYAMVSPTGLEGLKKLTS